jgi:hypothetical protein
LRRRGRIWFYDQNGKGEGEGAKTGKLKIKKVREFFEKEGGKKIETLPVTEQFL